MIVRTMKLQYVIYSNNDAYEPQRERVSAIAETEADAKSYIDGGEPYAEGVLPVTSGYMLCPDCRKPFVPEVYQDTCSWCYVKKNGRKCRKCKDTFFPVEKNHMYCDDCQHIIDIANEQ